MSIGFYPRYDKLGASSRYRFFMYFDRWKAEDPSADIAIYPGLNNKYLQKLYQYNRVGFLGKLQGFWHMYQRSHKLADKLIIEYELIPQLSWLKEKKLLGNRPYILNFDDNVWEKYRNNPLLQDKYDELCRHAAGVITANHFLTEKVKSLNKNTIMIPTVVDLDKYLVPPEEKKFDKFTIVWLGTPVTYTYLESHQEVLQQLTASGDCELLVVAKSALAAQRPLKNVKARYVDWSSESENEYLRRSHVGIMPLDDDEFSRGKSAFKLLQYQASGLPLLASPVGENKRVVIQGENGFLCNTPDEWRSALERLRNDSGLYEQCCKSSGERAKEYSLQKYFPVFKQFVMECFGGSY